MYICMHVCLYVCRCLWMHACHSIEDNVVTSLFLYFKALEIKLRLLDLQQEPRSSPISQAYSYFPQPSRTGACGHSPLRD